MTDIHQILKQSTIAAIFEDEYLWMKANRWWMVENNQCNMLLLLNADNMSLSHLDQVRKWMAQQKQQRGY